MRDYALTFGQFLFLKCFNLYFTNTDKHLCHLLYFHYGPDRFSTGMRPSLGLEGSIVLENCMATTMEEPYMHLTRAMRSNGDRQKTTTRMRAVTPSLMLLLFIFIVHRLPFLHRIKKVLVDFDCSMVDNEDLLDERMSSSARVV